MKPESFQIIYGGRAYNASYGVDGDVVSMESAYRSRAALRRLKTMGPIR